jgi:hypothetical protein
MTVPLDENHNHIADSWERLPEIAIYNKNLGEDWDEEDKPDLKAQKGDGIALFEEYRGFVFADEGKQAHFQRLLPTKKKLFVQVIGNDAELFRKGVSKFEDITKIEILYTRKEFAEAWQQGQHLIRWINFNETPWSHPASAVRIEDKGGDMLVAGGSKQNPPPGQTNFVDMAKAGRGARGTPQETEWINVSRANCERLVRDIYNAMNAPTRGDVQRTARNAHIDMALVKSYGDPSDAKSAFQTLAGQVIAFTTMHELGHATGALHHAMDALKIAPDDDPEWKYSRSGNRSCPMRYWHWDDDATGKLRFLIGQWDPSISAPDGGEWKFCSANSPNPDLGMGAGFKNDDWGNMRLK